MFTTPQRSLPEMHAPSIDLNQPTRGPSLLIGAHGRLMGYSESTRTEVAGAGSPEINAVG